MLLYKSHRLELSGYDPKTTNNRMEITAALQSLKTLKEPCNVKLHTDSSYLADAINKHWLASWKKNNWVKSDKNPVLNVDLWKMLLEQMSVHNVEFIWVKGHATNAENNRCDELATGEIRKHSH